MNWRIIATGVVLCSALMFHTGLGFAAGDATTRPAAGANTRPAGSATTRPAGGGAADQTDLTNLSLEDLMNVQVTSVSLSAQKISDAPAAVTVIGQDDIQRSGLN